MEVQWVEWEEVDSKTINMEIQIDLNELYQEIKNDELRELAEKVAEQHKNAKEETPEEIKEWAEKLANKLSTLTD